MPRITIAALAILFVVLSGCSDDEALNLAPDIGDSDGYKNLSEEWHVLFNLERAYDTMDADHYADLFDPDNFTFYFNPGDVGRDGVPTQWGYDSEIQSAQHMLGGVPGTQNISITAIDLRLANIENSYWEDTTLDEFPGETLRQTTVAYSFIFETNVDRWYISPSTVVPLAQFIVRKVDGRWKLVAWYDTLAGFGGAVSAGTEETSWGKIKALYQ